MIETIVLNTLGAELPVPVYMEAPEEKPASYVILEKTGASSGNRIDHATFAVQSIAQTLYQAAELNELVKTVMNQLPWLAEEIFGSELSGDYNFTNTATKERRYQAVYHITYKE